MYGTFVWYSAGPPPAITLKDEHGKETAYVIEAGAKVTLNGEAAQLSELKVGDLVRLVGTPAVKVKASRYTPSAEGTARGV